MRAWAVWGVGVAAYAVAVFHRSSLGVAGIIAQHRFHASPAELSLFAVLQLAVYAALQIPVGVLVDRFGSRRLIVTGALVMGAGQLVLALATTVPAAVGARVLVGGGDAMTFISVLRLVPRWFPARRVPLVTQLTGTLGQLGQVAATYPLVMLLHGVGWTPTFAGVAGLSVLTAAAVAATLRDAPPGAEPVRAGVPWSVVRAHLREAWHEPGTRMGLATHFSTQFSGTVFALLWGYPFLVAGEGLGRGTAGALLSLLVAGSMVFAPALGRAVGVWPYRRSAVVLGIVGASAAAWAVVLAWPGRAPLSLLVVLVVVLASNGPGSMVGFDFARTENPARRLGSASGIVNVGGFVASLSTILLVGVVVDVLNPYATPGVYSLGALKAGFAVQYLVWAAGLAGVLRQRRQLRARLFATGVALEPLPRAVARRLRDGWS